MDDDDRWWPSDADLRDPTGPPMRAAELCYAALGPIISHQLLAALDAFPETSLSPAVNALRSELHRCDGRPPSMLVLLAAAMAHLAENEFPHSEHDPAASHPVRFAAVRRNHIASESYKLLGWLTVEAVRQFGWDEQTFLEYCDAEWSYLDARWPPAGAAYTRRPPESADARVPAHESSDSDEFHDPFGIWQDLNDRRPTLIGAHLAQLPQLERFLGMLDAGLENAADDLETTQGVSPDHDSRAAAQLESLHVAVRRAHEAADMLRSVQGAILRVFPT